MTSPNHDIGMIAVLLRSLQTERLPKLQVLKQKVDSGERLGDADIEYLNRAFADIKSAHLQPLLERHPE